MNLEEQVTSLKLSKKLNKTINQYPALFFWVAHKERAIAHGDEAFSIMNIDQFADFDEEVTNIQRDFHSFPAYSVAELMNMLPAFIKIKGQEPFDCYTLSIKKCSTKNIQYVVNYHCDTTVEEDCFIPHRLWQNNIFGEQLADCLAEALIRITTLEKVINNAK